MWTRMCPKEMGTHRDGEWQRKMCLYLSALHFLHIKQRPYRTGMGMLFLEEIRRGIPKQSFQLIVHFG